jgi:hypothetical protein
MYRFLSHGLQLHKTYRPVMEDKKAGELTMKAIEAVKMKVAKMLAVISRRGCKLTTESLGGALWQREASQQGKRQTAAFQLQNSLPLSNERRSTAGFGDCRDGFCPVRQ